MAKATVVRLRVALVEFGWIGMEWGMSHRAVAELSLQLCDLDALDCSNVSVLVILLCHATGIHLADGGNIQVLYMYGTYCYHALHYPVICC